MARNGSGTYSVPNTFVSGQTITASSHNGNWSDIGTEITNSVAADGQTTITAGLKGANGTVSLPAYSFASDLDSGIYRIGANNIGVGVNGAKVLDIGTGGLTVTGTLAATSDFAINTNKFTVTASSGNTLVAGTLTVTGTSTLTDVALGPNGTKTAPSYGFTSDTDTGIYRIGANNLGVSCGDTKILDVATTGLTVTGSTTVSSGFTVSAGSVSLPAGSVANAALAAPGGLVKIQTQTASNVATLDFTTGLDDTYDAYELVVSNFKPASDDVEAWLRIGTGGTPTYQTSGYEDHLGYTYPTATTGQASASTGAIRLTIATGSTLAVGNATGENFCATIMFHNPEVTDFMQIYFTSGWSQANGNSANGYGGGRYNTAGVVTGIRLMFSSGNISSGRATLYGRTKA